MKGIFKREEKKYGEVVKRIETVIISQLFLTGKKKKYVKLVERYETH